MEECPFSQSCELKENSKSLLLCWASLSFNYVYCIVFWRACLGVWSIILAVVQAGAALDLQHSARAVCLLLHLDTVAGLGL